MQILASGKTAANKYDLLENDPTKVLARLDVRQMATSNQFALEATQGFSYSGDEGSESALDDNLSIIDVSNIAAYKKDLSQTIQTFVANDSRLDLDPSSTANSLILTPHTIPTGLAPDGNSYLQAAPLPFKWEDGLTFKFRATSTNTTAVVAQIPSLAGLSGAIGLLSQQNAALVGGEILINNFYTVVTATISSVKKLILVAGGTATNYNVGTTPGTIPVVGTTSATTSVAGLSMLAFSSDVITGTNTDKAITPAALRASYSFVKATTGYKKDNLGFIEQWGVVSLSGGASSAITLPIAFPTVFTGATAQAESLAVNEDPAGTVRTSLSQISVSNGFGGAIDVMWRAYGY